MSSFRASVGVETVHAFLQKRRADVREAPELAESDGVELAARAPQDVTSVNAGVSGAAGEGAGNESVQHMDSQGDRLRVQPFQSRQTASENRAGMLQTSASSPEPRQMSLRTSTIVNSSPGADAAVGSDDDDDSLHLSVLPSGSDGDAASLSSPQNSADAVDAGDGNPLSGLDAHQLEGVQIDFTTPERRYQRAN